MAPYVFTAVWRAGKTLRPGHSSYPRRRQDSTGASRAVASQDQDYRRLLEYVTTGFPSNRYSLHASILPYWKLRDSLYADGELVLHGPRIVVPATLRRRTLTHLHDSHRGVEATRRRARQTVYWPGIDSDIKSTVEACDSCQRLQPSQQQEPYLCDDQPSRPFESVSADFFQVAGKSFLVIADRLSGWPVVTPCGQDTTATKVMRMFCRYFREVGVPVRLRTDGGPPFTSEEFRRFTERWGVHHLVTSPHYPQSNGHAEAAVKSVKYLILKTAPDGNIDCEAFDRGLLELRNTPTPAGRSPAQILLSVGQRVRIQDHKSLRWDKVGVVMGCGRSRQYEVRLPSGRVWWRNRRHLRPVPVPSVNPHSCPLCPLAKTRKQGRYMFLPLPHVAHPDS
nr:uncharacterized protein K02A2.6-like [Penaeus vannamei]